MKNILLLIILTASPALACTQQPNWVTRPIPEITYLGRCSTFGTCHACSTCNYCGPCAQGGNTCSVCR